MGWSRIRRLAGGGLLLLALLTLAGCTSGGGSKKSTARAGGGSPSDSAAYVPLSDTGEELPAWATNPPPRGPNPAASPRETARPPQGEPCPPPCQAPPQPRGPMYRVTWEALAVEQDRFENPRFGRRNQPGVLNTQKVVLVNESHPEAQAGRRGQLVRASSGVAAGAIPDGDMQLFLGGIEQRGFFRLARPTGSMKSLFDDGNARGRITVERGGESVTLVSMRGQGLDPSTKAIPAMYSEVKQAIMLLRNQTRSMSVVGFSRDPVRR